MGKGGAVKGWSRGGQLNKEHMGTDRESPKTKANEKSHKREQKPKKRTIIRQGLRDRNYRVTVKGVGVRE